ncbi:MAG: CPBP family intramembrane metalloprotease [Bacteroidales bacterium]|nr:CPBP family intramembrane metalloprotease [Bacteroidales bacterium]
MLPFIIRNLILFGFALLLAVLIDYKQSIRNWRFLLLFIVFGIADNLFYILTETYPDFQIIRYHTWDNNLGCNWSAKIYSIVLAMILLIPLKRFIKPIEIGLTIKQNKGSIRFSLLCVIFVFVAAICIGYLSKKGSFDAKTLLYLAIMPGINEELIYRGFLLGFLNKIFAKEFKLSGTSFGWGAIISSIVFGLLHGFNLTENFHFQFDYMAILSTSFYGFIFALLKERSGSLFFPIIAHGTLDFFIFFIRMI